MVDGGYECVDRGSYTGTGYCQILLGSKITKSGILTSWCVYMYHAGTVNLRIYRPSGSQYLYIGGSSASCPIGLSTHSANINVEVGDIIGYYAPDAAVEMDWSGGNCYDYKDYDVDVTSDTAKSDWVPDDNYTRSIGVTVSVPEGPVITSVGVSPDPPKLCEPVQFISTVTWNDDGWKSGDQGTGLQRGWWQYTRSTAEYNVDTCADELSWTQFADTQWPEHIFIEEHADIKHIRHIVENKYGERACMLIENFSLESTDGLTITVDPALRGKPLCICHVAEVLGTGLWYYVPLYDYMEWSSVDPDVAYHAITGGRMYDMVPIPDNWYGATFTGDVHCVVLVKDVDMMLNTNIFYEKDVFYVYKNQPTCVHIATASNDVITEVFMGPVCDFFEIPRGSECDMFWAEFYDPVYVANYISIMTTGKDTIGDTRELGFFDHLAFLFAVIGSLPILNLFPFGAFISKGIKSASKFEFGDAAMGWMRTIEVPQIDPLYPKIWYESGVVDFFNGIVQLTGAHADEVLGKLSAGDISSAESLYKHYFKTDWGKTTLANYKDMFQKLRDGMPDDDAFLWTLEECGLSKSTLAAVLGTLQKLTPTTTELSDAAEVMDDAGVLGKAADSVYITLKTLRDASEDLYGYVKNVLKNSPTVATHVVAKHKAILNAVIDGSGDIKKDEVLSILNHCEVAPDDIHNLLGSIQVTKLIPKLADGDYKQVLGNFIEMTDSQYDNVAQLGKTKVDEWMINNAKISNTAIESTEPMRMSDIVCDAQKTTADTGKEIDDVCGTRS